jgi:hypothetical protein
MSLIECAAIQFQVDFRAQGVTVVPMCVGSEKGSNFKPQYSIRMKRLGNMQGYME